MLFKEIIAVYCEDYKKPTHTLCGRNVELLNVIISGIYAVSSHCALKVRRKSKMFPNAEALYRIRDEPNCNKEKHIQANFMV
jgi:ssDNA-binding Zn-finger/Zn-ribbon topoisomerase 1